jgi:hypothetical protein
MQRELLGCLGPEVQNFVYFGGERLQSAEVYYPLARLKTLNAFLALLLLSRELSELDRKVEAEVPAHLALAIYPEVIRREVVLQPVRFELIDVLRVKYWTTSIVKEKVSTLLSDEGWKTVENPERSAPWLWSYMHMNAIIGLRMMHKGRLSAYDILALHKESQFQTVSNEL